jgi:hypothetical protein
MNFKLLSVHELERTLERHQEHAALSPVAEEHQSLL